MNKEKYYRGCELALCEPHIVLFGRKYGVCPLRIECSNKVICGYAFTRNEINKLTTETKTA